MPINKDIFKLINGIKLNYPEQCEVDYYKKKYLQSKCLLEVVMDNLELYISGTSLN